MASVTCFLNSFPFFVRILFLKCENISHSFYFPDMFGKAGVERSELGLKRTMQLLKQHLGRNFLFG